MRVVLSIVYPVFFRRCCNAVTASSGWPFQRLTTLLTKTLPRSIRQCLGFFKFQSLASSCSQLVSADTKGRVSHYVEAMEVALMYFLVLSRDMKASADVAFQGIGSPSEVSTFLSPSFEHFPSQSRDLSGSSCLASMRHVLLERKRLVNRHPKILLRE